MIKRSGENRRQIINKSLCRVGTSLFRVFTRKYIKNGDLPYCGLNYLSVIFPAAFSTTSEKSEPFMLAPRLVQMMIKLLNGKYFLFSTASSRSATQ